MSSAKSTVTEILDLADIKINGSRPWDLQVHNEDFYDRVLAQGEIGFGESYMDGWWDCDQIDQLVTKIIRSDIKKHAVKKVLPHAIRARLFNTQRKSKAFDIGEQHYDIGNDLYERMLDGRMVYTCGYWKDTDSLDVAQEQKLDLTCRKIGLKPGMHVLDIGCGWGSFAKFAAEKYGVRVTGVTVSKEQVDLGNEICRDLPVEIILQDYRDMEGKYDRIVSLGMFEHVGYKNYDTFMKIAQRCLKDDGLFLLHTIGGNRSARSIGPWMNKYIFPNAMLPSVVQISKAIEGRFIMEDWHNFGSYYDKTLMAWFENFNRWWPEIKDKYGDRFYRMWKFYLLTCAGSSRSREIQLWQIVLSKKGVPGGYTPIR